MLEQCLHLIFVPDDAGAAEAGADDAGAADVVALGAGVVFAGAFAVVDAFAVFGVDHVLWAC